MGWAQGLSGSHSRSLQWCEALSPNLDLPDSQESVTEVLEHETHLEQWPGICGAQSPPVACDQAPEVISDWLGRARSWFLRLPPSAMPSLEKSLLQPQISESRKMPFPNETSAGSKQSLSWQKRRRIVSRLAKDTLLYGVVVYKVCSLSTKSFQKVLIPDGSGHASLS